MPFSLFTEGAHHDAHRKNAGRLHIDAIVGACREACHYHKKVVLLLNFPHNQTGFMPSTEDIEKLAHRLHALMRENPAIPFVILLDDAYEGYVYDETGQKFSPASQLFTPLPNLTLIKMDGISKVMLAYGYRVGFITAFVNSLDGGAPPVLAEISNEFSSKVGGFIRGEISQVNHHGQVLADALMDDWERVSKERAKVIAMLAARWEVMMKAIQKAYKKYGKERIWVDPCNAGFFAYFNLDKGLDAKEIADCLLREKRIGVVPSGQGLRVAFAGVAKEKIGRMVEGVFEAAQNPDS